MKAYYFSMKEFLNNHINNDYVNKVLVDGELKLFTHEINLGEKVECDFNDLVFVGRAEEKFSYKM